MRAEGWRVDQTVKTLVKPIPRIQFLRLTWLREIPTNCFPPACFGNTQTQKYTHIHTWNTKVVFNIKTKRKQWKKCKNITFLCTIDYKNNRRHEKP